MMRNRSVWLTAILAATLAGLSPAVRAAERTRPESEIVVDASTGRSLYAANAARRRPPASLAKMMTLLLVFDALRTEAIKPHGDIVMTASGARQAPSRLGLQRGRTLSVTQAVRAVAVISANDVAVALADRLSGSEGAFVARMNRRAAEIGMVDTRFGNATGLAPGAGYTTARDIAVLARYVIQRYPERYKLFATRSIRWKGWVRPNHNKLLGKIKGVDGMKTGYTVAAGFNLAASARRDGRRVIVVVMGARTAADRDLLVANLLESGFTSTGAPRPKLALSEPRATRSGQRSHAARARGGHSLSEKRPSVRADTIKVQTVSSPSRPCRTAPAASDTRAKHEPGVDTRRSNRRLRASPPPTRSAPCRRRTD